MPAVSLIVVADLDRIEVINSMATEAVDMPDISWKAVVLILGLVTVLMGGVIVLSHDHQDVTAVLGALVTTFLVIISILGARQAQTIQGKLEQASTKVDQVKEQNNGRMDQLMEMVKELQQQNVALATQVQPLPITPLSPAAAPTAPAPAEPPSDHIP